MRKWLNLALKIAPQGKHHCHRLGAVVVRSGQVISKATNISRPYGKENGGRHAEARALRPHMNCNGATLYVAREGGSMSRPCEDCWEKIRTSGIRKVVYMNWDSELVVEYA